MEGEQLRIVVWRGKTVSYLFETVKLFFLAVNILLVHFICKNEHFVVDREFYDTFHSFLGKDVAGGVSRVQNAQNFGIYTFTSGVRM
jgi:hypothetical protein